VPRTKTAEQMIAEFNELYRLNYRGPIFLVDDNFIGNKKNVKILLERLIPWMEQHQYPFPLATEATVNLADDLPLIKLMRRAGFTRVFLGIETPSIESLKETQKYQNTRKDMVASVHTIIEQGIEVLAGFIVGFDNDGPDIFDRQIQFIEQAEIPWAMVGTLNVLPATQLWDRLQKEGRLLGTYPKQFGRANFVTKMDSDALLNGYYRILRTIYSPDIYFNRLFNVLARQDRADLVDLPRVGLPRARMLAAAISITVALGIRAPYRRTWWKFMGRIVRSHPSKVPQALLNSALGHHFLRYTSEVVNTAAC
jgi:radical SAM superfamily enzyme YgiQ (UPF0313 family)